MTLHPKGNPTKGKPQSLEVGMDGRINCFSVFESSLELQEDLLNSDSQLNKKEILSKFISDCASTDKSPCPDFEQGEN